MDLWSLNPQEFMAAHYLEMVGGRSSGREVAQIIGVGERTGRRILESLAAKGLIQRVSQGRYLLLWLAETRSPVAASRSPMTESKVLLLVGSNKPVLVDMSNDISTRAAPPSRGHNEKRFPMADDLEPGRLKPPAPKPAKRTLFKKPDKYHRLTQPPETWGISHVVKEFEIRSLQAFPDSIYVPEGRRLSSTLSMAQRDYGLTVPQMLTAIDQFFRFHANNVPAHTPPTRHFLAYLKRYIEQQPGNSDIDPLKWEQSQ